MAPRFSLQNVLDVRHSKVEALEIELGNLLTAQSEAEAQLESLKNWRFSLLGQLEKMMQGELDLFSVDRVRADIHYAEEQSEVAEEELKKIIQKVEIKRKELVAAKQSEEVLQILKQKRVDAFNVEQAQKEARAQDDIYIAMSFRQRAQEA